MSAKFIGKSRRLAPVSPTYLFLFVRAGKECVNAFAHVNCCVNLDLNHCRDLHTSCNVYYRVEDYNLLICSPYLTPILLVYLNTVRYSVGQYFN